MGGVIKLNITIMEQFNLEKYLANPSRKVVTRNGRNARIICTDRRDLNFPIIALIENISGGGEKACSYTKDGRHYTDCSDIFDLFFAPEKHEEQITVERFNPNTLKPYDKVLVRDCNIGIWVCDFFSHIRDKDTYPFYCVGNYYRCCIPYNDDTKHLIGTSELPSKYYRYWEE